MTPDGPRDRLSRLRPRSLGLRARITAAFTFGAFFLSLLLAGTTFAVTRAELIDQRVRNALNQVYVNASTVRDAQPADVEEEVITGTILPSLRTPIESSALIRLRNRDRWYRSTADVTEEAIPPELILTVGETGQPARMRVPFRGTTALFVGVPLRQVGAEYYEIVELSELEETLDSLAISLVIAGAVTTALGAALGWWASRRTLRPLADVTQAAEAIASGRLDTRLEAGADPDLRGLAQSFNDMAVALEERVERDARFASDVSHELRSPLMTLSAAVDVLETRREELPERARSAVDLLSAELGRFSQLVGDLLEISRYDAGAVRLDLGELRLAEFVLQAVQASESGGGVPVQIDSELADVVVSADKRRLARVIANLVDNAKKYGDGATGVYLRRVEDGVELSVEDEGPGVPEDEREVIFARFARGGEAGRRGAGEGVGLGLALVAEHVRLHGGQVWVEDRSDGRAGARFVVLLPVMASTAGMDDEA